MRWKTIKKEKPKRGDERIINQFLFLPKTLENETRWLEFAYIKQIYTTKVVYLDHIHEGDMKYWKDLKFMDIKI